MDHRPEHKTKRKSGKENLCQLGLDKHFSQQDTKSMSQKRKKNYV